MIQNDDYTEFDLKALFFYMLRQWKPVLVLCLTAALLLGGLQAYQEYDTGLHVDMENSYWAEYQQYQDQIDFLEDRVSATQSKIDVLQDYIRNSVLMEADPRNIYIAKSSYYIDSGYKILPENTYQEQDKSYTLAWHYLNHLNDTTVFEKIGTQVGLEAKYLMELVTVTIPNDFTLSISVSHPSQQSANTIMAILQEEILTLHRQLADTVGEHSITQMLDSCGAYIDETLNETQQETYDELLDLQEDLIVYRDELMAMKEGSAPGELNVVSAFIKWFILGGGIAGVLSVVFLFVASILKNRLHAHSQLASGFGTAVLGEVICSRKKLSCASRLINRLEGCVCENSEENLQFLAENIRSHCADARSILICSDTDASLSTALADILGSYLPELRLLPVGSLLKEAAALRGLGECDAVVMVAARDRSGNAAIRKSMKLIQSCKKEVLGFIMTY